MKATLEMQRAAGKAQALGHAVYGLYEFWETSITGAYYWQECPVCAARVVVNTMDGQISGSATGRRCLSAIQRP